MFQSETEQFHFPCSAMTPEITPPFVVYSDFIQPADVTIDYKDAKKIDFSDKKNIFFITQDSINYSNGDMINIYNIPGVDKHCFSDESKILAEVITIFPNSSGELDLLDLQYNSQIIRNNKFVDNTVYFWDKGRYIITKSCFSNIFSSKNTSYIGLFQDNDIPETIFIPYIKDNYIYSFILKEKNIYFENVFFDGKSKELYTKSGFITIEQQEPYRKTSDFSDGLVLKNIIIANVGNHNQKDPLKKSKNTSLAIHDSMGQINIEQVRFINCKTKPSNGIIEISCSSQLYFKNIVFDMSEVYVGSLGNVFPIKLLKEGDFHRPVNAVFAGELHILGNNQPFTKGIFIQDYGYEGLHVPKNLRYIHFSGENGNETSPAAVISNIYSDQPASYGLFDLTEHCFVVCDSPYQTMEEQFLIIIQIINVMYQYRKVRSIKDIIIKLVTNQRCIQGFTLPTFIFDNLIDISVHLVAVKDIEDSIFSSDCIPIHENALFDISENKKVFFYYFDFHLRAHYTMQKAIYGITTTTHSVKDPFENIGIVDYPNYMDYLNLQDPKVKGSTMEMFRNCRFTSLLYQIEIEGNIQNKVLHVGESITISALPTVANNSFTVANAPMFDINNTAEDETIQWFLYGDSGIIDLVSKHNTAFLRALKRGLIMIIAKATDCYNQGEIIKPHVSISVTVL